MSNKPAWKWKKMQDSQDLLSFVDSSCWSAVTFMRPADGDEGSVALSGEKMFDFAKKAAELLTQTEALET